MGSAGERRRTPTWVRRIGELLPAAVGVAISPLPTVAVVLMLVTARGRVNGPTFVIGWLVGVAGAGTILLLLASGGDASEHGQPATWVDWLKGILGILLLLLSLRPWRSPPHQGQEPVTP